MCRLCAEYNNARKRVDQLYTLAGSSVLQQRLCGLSFRMSPLAFFQTNSQQTEVLYRAVADAAGVCTGLTGVPVVCGMQRRLQSLYCISNQCTRAGREQHSDRMP